MTVVLEILQGVVEIRNGVAEATASLQPVIDEALPRAAERDSLYHPDPDYRLAEQLIAELGTGKITAHKRPAANAATVADRVY